MMSRRFRLYRRFVLSTVSDDKFEHFRRNDLSLYILVNKRYVEDTVSYADELAGIVQKLMHQFSLIPLRSQPAKLGADL